MRRAGECDTHNYPICCTARLPGGGGGRVKPAATASAPLVAATPDKKMTQQEKMKACNKDAGEKKLKGDERKAFMKDCLSK